MSRCPVDSTDLFDPLPSSPWLFLYRRKNKETLSGIIPVATSKSHAEYHVLFDEEEHRKTPYTKNTIEILNLLLASMVHMTSHSRKHPKAKFHRRCVRKYSYLHDFRKNICFQLFILHGYIVIYTLLTTAFNLACSCHL